MRKNAKRDIPKQRLYHIVKMRLRRVYLHVFKLCLICIQI